MTMPPNALTREQVEQQLQELRDCPASVWVYKRDLAIEQIIALRQALAQQAQELASVDEILSRRPALAECTTRSEKIQLAINTAKRADALAQEVERLQASYDADMKHWTEQLAASQSRVKELEAEVVKWQRIRTPTHGNCCTCQRCGLDHDSCRCDLDEVYDELTQLQATLAEREARTKELEEWQKIVIGSGTDQETVIRMAANEYTKSAVQCWKEHTKKIEADLDTAHQDAARLRIVIKTILFQVAQGKVLERDACISEAKRVYEDTKPT